MEQYERLKVLGVGSFGKVYLMRHRRERRLVCAKIIKVRNIPRKEKEACKTEVDLLRRLHHPNIVGYRDSFLTPRKDHLCIVMEYCDGGDLSEQIKNARRRLFAESKILHWFVQIALGLHYMHSRLVLHRDLKTQNIFMLGNGRLVLGDLGISKVLEGTMDFASTRIGTPYYMSPELFTNKPYNHKSDIWALGCVLYEMAALTHAFDAQSLHGLASRVAKGRYPSINVKYSRNLRDLISRMLSTSPNQRPDLDQILQLGFIKKHIQNFLADIVSRENHKIGEGTMVFRAAAVNMLADAEGSSNSSGVDGRVNFSGQGSNPEMLSLKRQMEDLGLQEEVKKALRPPETKKPTNARAAAKVVKEQTGALRREEDRRKAVESALVRLRKEREERLQLRHARERGNIFPPPAPAAADVDVGSKDSRVSGGWQAGVVGVGVGLGSGGLSGEVKSKKGGEEARAGARAGALAADVAVVARQLETAAGRRMGCPLGAGGREPRQGGSETPDAPSHAVAAPRSREGRRSLEPRQRRDDSSSKVPSRGQIRHRSFAGDPRKAPPRIGVAAAAGGGGGGKVQSNAVDQSDVSRVKGLDEFGRAREAERLATEAMIRREATSREAARKRAEAVQRERDRDRLRQDKVELDRKMLEREQRRQKTTAAASKITGAKVIKEEQRQHQQQETAAVAAIPQPKNAAGLVPVPHLSVPRARARWANAANPDNIASPTVPAPVTNSAREAVQQQKKEKGKLEEAAIRNGIAALSAENGGRGREHVLPSQRPITASNIARAASAERGVEGGQYNAGTPLLEPVKGGGNSSSTCRSGSDESEDSDKKPWEVGGRGKARAERGKKGVARGRWGGRASGGKEACSGFKATEGAGEGPKVNGDEADEDIHAREELLEVELLVATTRCEELRHTLKETKSMIPAVGLFGMDGDGGSENSGGGHLGVRSGGQGSLKTTAGTTAATPPSHPFCSRLEVIGSDEDNDDEDEDEEDEEKDHEKSKKSVVAIGSGQSEQGGELCNKNRRGSYNYEVEDRPRSEVLRAWEKAITSKTTLPAGKITASRREKSGDGMKEGILQVGQESDSSEESINCHYPYDRSPLEREAEALNGNGDAPPKNFPPQNTSSQPQASAVPSSIIEPGAATADEKNGRSIARESKHSSRRVVTRAASGISARDMPGENDVTPVAVIPPACGALPSPPPSAPTGRLADRIRALRERCRLGLGTDTFESAYRYLKAQEDVMSDGESDSYMEDDRDERLVKGLTDILGKNKIHYYSLIDQLIFIENTHIGHF